MKQFKTKRFWSAFIIAFTVLLMGLNSLTWADAKSKRQWELLQEQKKAEEQGREPKQIKKETSAQRQWRLKKEQEKKKKQ